MVLVTMDEYHDVMADEDACADSGYGGTEVKVEEGAGNTEWRGGRWLMGEWPRIACE